MSAIATVAFGALLVGIGLVLVEGLRRGDGATAVNAALSLLVPALPPALDLVGPFLFDARIAVGPELPVWLAAAGLAHSVGMLGPYDSIWWWDVLTHLLSAALVAALVYAGVIVAGNHGLGIDLITTHVAVVTVAFTFAVGVLWELVELVARDVGARFDVAPVLVHYGWRDTAGDLVVDVAGAVLVVLLDLQTFGPLAAQVPAGTTTLVLWCGVTTVAGIVLLGPIVGAGLVGRSDG